MRRALTASGLDPETAQDLAKRYCFTRAKTKLKAEGLIEEVEETPDRWIFQLSERFKQSNGIQYSKRCLLWYDKENQLVGSDEPSIQRAGQGLFDRAGEVYRAADVSALLRRILDKQRAVLSLRKGGAIYFVPEQYAELLNKIKQFIQDIGGNFNTIKAGYDCEDVKTKGISMLIEKCQAELSEVVEDVKAHGLTQVRASNRWNKLVQQIDQIKVFAESLQADSGELLRQISTTEFDLVKMDESGGDITALVAMAQNGELGGTLAQLAMAVKDKPEVEAEPDEEQQAAPEISSEETTPSIELPVVETEEQALPEVSAAPTPKARGWNFKKKTA